MSCRDGRLRDIVSARAGWRLWPAVIRRVTRVDTSAGDGDVVESERGRRTWRREAEPRARGKWRGGASSTDSPDGARGSSARPRSSRSACCWSWSGAHLPSGRKRRHVPADHKHAHHHNHVPPGRAAAEHAAPQRAGRPEEARRHSRRLSDLMDHFAGDEPDRVAKDDLSKDIEDLRAAVGLEEEL